MILTTNPNGRLTACLTPTLFKIFTTSVNIQESGRKLLLSKPSPISILNLLFTPHVLQLRFPPLNNKPSPLPWCLVCFVVTFQETAEGRKEGRESDGGGGQANMHNVIGIIGQSNSAQKNVKGSTEKTTMELDL